MGIGNKIIGAAESLGENRVVKAELERIKSIKGDLEAVVADLKKQLSDAEAKAKNLETKLEEQRVDYEAKIRELTVECDRQRERVVGDEDSKTHTECNAKFLRNSSGTWEGPFCPKCDSSLVRSIMTGIRPLRCKPCNRDSRIEPGQEVEILAKLNAQNL